MIRIHKGLSLALLTIVPAYPLFCQTSAGTSGQSSDWRSSLPVPTGVFKVGRATVHWIDTSRIEPLSPDHDYRELMVDIWYPADPSTGATAPYLDSVTFEHVLGAEGFRGQFRGASDAILAGVKTHAVLAAPFAGTAKGVARRSPVLVFSPGGGMIREVYTSQMEDLASHGYIVAAISHPYDAILTILPDGHYIEYNSKRWPATPSLAGVVNLNQLQWHAEDIRFVVRRLIAMNENPPSELPFAPFIDPSRIGVFGHSFGGMAAGHTCQLDTRVKACLDEDGVAAKQPFYLDDRGWGLDQAYMLIERASSTSLPSDQELAAHHLTRKKAEDLFATLVADHNGDLQRTRKGSYDVILTDKGTSHEDFSDLPLLASLDGAELQKREHFLQVIETYTRAFFDQKLSGMPEPLLNKSASGDLVVRVDRFKPATAPCSNGGEPKTVSSSRH